MGGGFVIAECRLCLKKMVETQAQKPRNPRPTALSGMKQPMHPLSDKPPADIFTGTGIFSKLRRLSDVLHATDRAPRSPAIPIS
jgi:hypothetical protein